MKAIQMENIEKYITLIEESCKNPENQENNPYWTTNVYGVSKIYKQYGYYPQSKPLYFYSSHGTSVAEMPSPHELENNAPLIFYNSPRFVNKYRQISKKPSYCVISPFAYYRKSNNITPKKLKNTICFFAHTTPIIDDVSDVTEYIKQLNMLDAKYQPITVCLHYHDINKGLHNKFLEHNFEVVTAGSPYHTDFIERFYNILSEYSYAISNDVGSYLFYAVEMDIPFFLYGNEPVYINKGDANIEIGLYTSYKNYPQMLKAKDLFKQPVEQVTPEQKSFVEKELGVYDTIPRWKFSLLLYWAWAKTNLNYLKIQDYFVSTFKKSIKLIKVYIK